MDTSSVSIQPKSTPARDTAKRQIIEEILIAGASVARIARAHGVNANQVFYWWKLYRGGRLGAAALLPVTVASESPRLLSDPNLNVSSTASQNADAIQRQLIYVHAQFSFLCRAHQIEWLLQRRYSHPVDKNTGVRSDQTGILSSFESASVHPDPLRKMSYRDAETGKRLTFLTNNFTLPALTIAQIYKRRWQVELFFKWVKQHLRIKAFYGTQRERGEDANLDRGVGLCVRSYRAQATGIAGQLVSNSTDSQPHAFRENTHGKRLSEKLRRTPISAKPPTN